MNLGRIVVGLAVAMTTAPAMTARADGRSTTWYLPSLLLTMPNELSAGTKGRDLFVPLVTVGTSSCETEAIDEGLRVIARVAELFGGAVASSMLLAEPCGRPLSTTPVVMPAQVGRGGYGITVVGRF